MAACASAGSQPADTLAPSPASPSPAVRAPSPIAPATPGPTVAPAPVPTPSPTDFPLRRNPPFTVAIDPGHGGPYYFGATHLDGQGKIDLIEKDIDLDVALRLDVLLRQAGYQTMLTRDGDYTLTAFDPADYRLSQRIEMQARVDKANQTQADIVLSVHFNGADDRSQSGTEVYYNPERSFGENNRALAIFVHDALISAIRALGYDVRDRGVKNDAEVGGDPANPHSYLLGTNADFRASLMPGVIAEPLFLSNDQEADLLRRDDVRQAIAAAYKTGVDAYFAWLSGR